MFDSELRALISNGDEQTFLWKNFLQLLEDCGGSSHHLNRLLKNAKDTKGDANLLEQFAKSVVGPIWKRVESPISLPFVSTQQSFSDFCDHYKGLGIRIHPNFLEGNAEDWTDDPPQGHCHYRLVHPQLRMTFQEILDMPVNHAGIRELFAYVAEMDAEEFSNCDIIAANSRLQGVADCDSRIFVKASANHDSGQAFISWQGFKREEDRCRSDLFCLVREYTQ